MKNKEKKAFSQTFWGQQSSQPAITLLVSYIIIFFKKFQKFSKFLIKGIWIQWVF